MKDEFIDELAISCMKKMEDLKNFKAKNYYDLKKDIKGIYEYMKNQGYNSNLVEFYTEMISEEALPKGFHPNIALRIWEDLIDLVGKDEDHYEYFQLYQSKVKSELKVIKSLEYDMRRLIVQNQNKIPSFLLENPMLPN